MEAMKRAEEERRKERKKIKVRFILLKKLIINFWQLAGGSSRGNVIGGTGATTGMVMVRCIS